MALDASQMSDIHQIVYRRPSGSNGMILQAGTSLTDRASGGRWLRRLEPWLRAGGPSGRGYLNLGEMAVLIRWHDDAGSSHSWRFAHAFVAKPSVLTSRFALLVPDLPAKVPSLPSGEFELPVVDPSLIRLSEPAETERRARSAEAVELVVPLLARILAGEQNITMQLTQRALPDAVLWGLLSLLEMLGDARPVSFLTNATGQIPAMLGLFISFRPGAAALQPDSGFETVARSLAVSYASSPAELLRALRQHGQPQRPDGARRIALLADSWLRPGPATVSGHATADDQTATGSANHPESVDSNTAAGGNKVICPICLTPIDNWNTLPRYRWDDQWETYVELNIPVEVTGPLRVDMELGSYRRCPDTFKVMPDNEHHLPADYGNFGAPVILGFVGLTASGKTHLLASMVGAMQAGLRQYDITCRALDRALHKKFEKERVRPLLNENEVLPGTAEGIVTFADAFLMRHARGSARPVVLFDIAGGDLANVDKAKKFLGIVNGLFFIVDPSQIEAGGVGDATFNNVLDLLKYTGRLEDEVSAAIVLNKADLVRFDDPVTRWLRSDGPALDADDFLLESRDVYAYLHAMSAAPWTLPYEECAKATLHVASPTGGVGHGEGEGAVYPRGVSPRRVLRPMLAMLAMTGVLTGPEAEKVGK
jgi:hypothetical protein